MNFKRNFKKLEFQSDLTILICFLISSSILMFHVKYSGCLPLTDSEAEKSFPDNKDSTVYSDSSQKNGVSSLLPFLKRFGYIGSSQQSDHEGESETLFTEESVKEAIKEMQRFGALPQTGELDNATLSLLSAPRCGLPDVHKNENSNSTRRRRYVIGAPGWNKRRLTYRVQNWAPQLTETSVLEDVRKAFNAWSDYARLQFVDKPRLSHEDVDISISFGRGYHGDEYPFDGSGGVLAHAFFPNGHGPLGGDIHFDLDENWASSSTPEQSTRESTILFLSVAIHEIGHSLGLAHSPSPDSVMFPYYQGHGDGSDKNVRLGYDDIMAMYQLYIQREIHDFGDDDINPTSTTTESISSTTPRVTITTERTKITTTQDSLGPDTVPNICRDGFDSISFIRNELFVFKDKFMWRYRTVGERDPLYPVEAFKLFPVLTGVPKVDAVFEDEEGRIIFFSGNHYWVHDDDRKGSRLISEFGLPMDLPKLDAAFIWGKNGKTYFFSGNLFWRYNTTTKTMDKGYPKGISRWRGIPDHGIDSAFKWSDGHTYFLKHNEFWRFDDTNVKTDNGYPLDTARYWFGC